MNNYYLTAFYFLVETTNSIIIALNILYKKININLTWKDSNLEYEYNQNKWGMDKELNEKLLLKKIFFIEIINFIRFFS